MNEIIVNHPEYLTICKILNIDTKPRTMSGAAFGEDACAVFIHSPQMGKELPLDGFGDSVQIAIDTTWLRLKIQEEITKTKLLEIQLKRTQDILTYASVKKELAKANGYIKTIKADFIGDPCSTNELSKRQAALHALENLCDARSITTSEILGSFKTSFSKLVTWTIATTKVILIVIKLMAYTIQSIMLFCMVSLNWIASTVNVTIFSSEKIMSIKSYRIFNNNPSIVLATIPTSSPNLPVHVTQLTSHTVLQNMLELQPHIRSLHESISKPKTIQKIEQAKKKLNEYTKCKCSASDELSCICTYNVPEAALAISDVLDVIEALQNHAVPCAYEPKPEISDEQVLQHLSKIHKDLINKQRTHKLTQQDKHLLHTLNETYDAFKHAQQNAEHELEALYL